MTKYEVAIVGGGIAGLTASIYAAKAGKRTIILEQQKQLGGRAITIKKQGVYFNLGAHALYKGEAYEAFRELGLRLEGGTPSIDAYGMWKEQILPLPTNTFSFFQTPLLSWGGKLDLAKWFIKLGKMDTSVWNHISIRDWIETQLHDPMLRNLFYALLRTSTYVLAPELHAAGPALKQLQRSLKGVLYLDKGWGTLVEELRELAVRQGVKLVTGCKVIAVEHQDQKVHSILCESGTRIEAANIILTTPPSFSHKLVPHADQTALDTWNKQAIPVTVACLDVGLRQLPIHEHQFIYGLDQPIFFTNQSREGKPRPAILSDDGTQLISLFKYQGPQTDAAKDEQELEQVLDMVQPGWQNELVIRQFLPKMTVVHDFPHIKRKVDPGPAVPEIKGLYVAGDWASHGELLVDASVASAKRAVSQLLNTREEIKL
ncbi:FAD-dependent oxidoreductase [Bacillus sp. DTU_2020_1000418_1_SI_GHA_SEK_038]|uniref:phytoene desaturase family protein n=1 Tax=Bacillus sp. DTU_2020_1000418_1_SI_GHA_SEK_038 TaxID=3077585 RepID=UPI0028EAEFB6|nr:FAD-dependent oxidoreductase [Bacillus sp. DTU_2020_1000418_1_SI_GHA_SEK_038]WNS76479.1 FAD-dependent oxidoreductase [Bacillus sp. DTU_2020_1000418_1_SI_GHA_SEK_038]